MRAANEGTKALQGKCTYKQTPGTILNSGQKAGQALLLNRDKEYGGASPEPRQDQVRSCSPGYMEQAPGMGHGASPQSGLGLGVGVGCKLWVRGRT